MKPNTSEIDFTDCPIDTISQYGGSDQKRGIIHLKSDVDLCSVFADDVELYSREMRIFRSMLRGAPTLMEADVVRCTVSQLASNSCLLYREINRDKIILSD